MPQVATDQGERLFDLTVIFTGHMIDTVERPSPRFPPEMEDLVAAAIREQIISAQQGHRLIGVASGARGGDIIFLESCLALGVEARMVLPFSRSRFLPRSVTGAAGDGEWERRFEALWDDLGPEHRKVLRPPEDRNPFDFCNARMLALGRSLARSVRLLALWDGKGEPRPGGTAAFIELVRSAGGTVSRIHAEKLLPKVEAPPTTE